MPARFPCPICNKDISIQWFGQHLWKLHEEYLMSKELSNHLRIKDSVWHSKPLQIVVNKKAAPDQYYFCMACHHGCVKEAWAAKHFPKCQADHKKRCMELHQKYSSEPLSPETSSAPIVMNVEGWKDEQVEALIGSLMKTLHNYQLENAELRQWKSYAEEQILDAPQDFQDEFESEEPTFDEAEVELDKPSDITNLYNIARKIGFAIKDKSILENYHKYEKMPLKKGKST